MNVERVDRIVYRFTRQEISALLKLMGKARLPGLPVFAQVPDTETVNSLAKNSIILPAGERVFTDRTVALILRSAADSSRYLMAKSQAGRIALYKGEKLLVLIEDAGARIIKVEPLENLSSARDPWLNAVGNLGEGVEITFTGGETKVTEAGNAEKAEAFLSRLTDSEV